jgi:NAD(P)-dependent dehydrogenase (short-subunit alcohol dehydrogenase family)
MIEEEDLQLPSGVKGIGMLGTAGIRGSFGIIKTPMHSPQADQALAMLHPMGRMGDISDVVDGVMYLESAPFVTGEILHIDGGHAAGHHKI